MAEQGLKFKSAWPYTCVDTYAMQDWYNRDSESMKHQWK